MQPREQDRYEGLEQRAQEYERAAEELYSMLFGEPPGEPLGEAAAQEEKGDSAAKPRVPSADAGEHGIGPLVKKSPGEMIFEALLESGAYRDRDSVRF